MQNGSSLPWFTLAFEFVVPSRVMLRGDYVGVSTATCPVYLVKRSTLKAVKAIRCGESHYNGTAYLKFRQLIECQHLLVL